MSEPTTAEGVPQRDPVRAALARVWPAELRTERLVLRPVTEADATVIGELLTDSRVRRFLGGPASPERVRDRQAAYPSTPGAWAVAYADGGEVIGLVTITEDHRSAGRAEVSYQFISPAWGRGLANEAVGEVLSWWRVSVPEGGPLVAITQERNARSCRLLTSLGMVLADLFTEYGERQCMYVNEH